MSPGLDVGAQCVSADLTFKAAHRASEQPSHSPLTALSQPTQAWFN